MLNIAIFIIDDNHEQRFIIDKVLKNNNIENYRIFDKAEDLIEALHEGVQICILDYNLGDSNHTGLTIMRDVLKCNSSCKCIIMSGYDDPDTIVEFLNSGAFRYLPKGIPEFYKNMLRYIGEARTSLEKDYTFWSTLKNSVDDTHKLLITYRNNHSDGKLSTGDH